MFVGIFVVLLFFIRLGIKNLFLNHCFGLNIIKIHTHTEVFIFGIFWYVHIHSTKVQNRAVAKFAASLSHPTN